MESFLNSDLKFKSFLPESIIERTIINRQLFTQGSSFVLNVF